MENFFDFLYEHEHLYIVIDLSQKIWFNAMDIAKILAYRAPLKAVAKYVPAELKLPYEKINVPDKVYSKSYQRKSLFLDEAGLYRLIFKSRQANAKRFQNWVTDKLLPKIRMEGYYILRDKIELLQNKMKKIRNEKRMLLDEIDYLDNGKNYGRPKYGFIYIIKVKTQHRGKSITCYKLGRTNDLKHRIRNYRTGNPNVKLVHYYPLEHVNSDIIELVSKAILKYSELKKNNEIYCTTLKNVYDVLDQTIGFIDHMSGTCGSCQKEMSGFQLRYHRCAD